MPIYEFTCGNCSQQFALLVIHKKLDQLKCPYCGAGKVEKKFSTFSSVSNHPHSSPCAGGSCPFPNAMAQGGGDCAGGCCCH